MNWKSYPKYRDSGIEWLEQIPKHWNVKKQAWNFRSAMGQTILKDDLEDDGEVAVYSATESGVIFGRINNPLVELNKGDIVIPARGVSIGYAILIKERSTCTQTTIYCKLLTQNLIHSPYIRYYMLGLRDLLFYYDRTAIPQITVDQVSSNPLLIPPVFEQNIIEIFLDHETTRIDVLLEKKEKQIELLQEKRQAIITQAVTKGLDPNVPMKDSGVEWIGEIPVHWKIKPLKHSVQLINEKNGDLNLVYIGLENIESWTGVHLESEEVQEVEGQSNIFKSGDVLFGKLRPYLAKVFCAHDSGICSSEFLIIRPKLLIQEFLFYYILSKDFIETVDSSTYGTKMPRANWEFVGILPVLIPDKEEQINIVNFIKTELNIIDVLIKKTRESINLLSEYRSALITAAVTGKIDVRDFVQETAEKTEIIK